MRNQGAMLGDAAVREGYVQGAMARGFEAAGSNAGGSATAFMGMGMGMNAAGGFGAFSETNRAAMERDAVKKAANGAWQCTCGETSTGKFCQNCGKQKPSAAGEWVCPTCGAKNSGKFCAECGAKAPDTTWFCTECGTENTGKFCQNCGNKKG